MARLRASRQAPALRAGPAAVRRRRRGTFRGTAELPADSFGVYIISMAIAPSDVLAVELLQRECGAKRPMRVVPLFEKLADLQRAGAPPRHHGVPLLHRLVQTAVGGRQEIMIGYSDSASTSPCV